MVNSRRATPWVVAVLVLCGAVCLGLRLYSRYEVEMLQGDSVWRLTYNISFRAPKAGTKLRAAMPSDGRHSRVFRQDLRYSGLNVERLRPSRTDTREISVATQREGDFRISARFDMHLSQHGNFRLRTGPAQLSADERAQYLRSAKAIQADSREVMQTLQRFQGIVANQVELMEKLFEYCHTQIVSGGEDAPSDAAGVLEKGSATPLGRARALVALCRAGKIPARLVAGFEVKESSDVRPHVWVEVLANSHWEPYDPENGFARELPYRLVPARRDGVDIVHAPGVSDLQATFSLARIPPPGGLLGRRSRRLIDILDLTRLPVEMHEVLSIILLMPLGALVTSVFRTLIGVRTFGTFTPTLLALSFVYADWRAGLVVFAVVVGLGLAARSMLDRLKLLVVPRLSVILTLVVLCIVFAVSWMEYLGRGLSTQAVLLPMVILTMTIERFYLTTEEDGSRFAVQLMAGTLVVAFCCYMVLRWEEVGRLLLIYPEVHFFTVGVLVLMGRYTGYRLTELWRFRDFDQPGT